MSLYMVWKYWLCQEGGGGGSDHAKIFLWIWYCVHRPTWVTMDTRKWPISPPISYTFPQLSLILNKLTISPKWIFILKYIDLRTFVVKISRQGQGHGQGQGGPLSTYQTIYFVKAHDTHHHLTHRQVGQGGQYELERNSRKVRKMKQETPPC